MGRFTKSDPFRRRFCISFVGRAAGVLPQAVVEPVG